LARQASSEGKDVLSRATAVRSYLQNNYSYSTTDLPAQSSDPISEFLFVKKSGHCEYFASSLVIMLRHLGIPARLVNGFREGEYNAIGDFFIVRNSDAHSWAEVFAGGQWTPMDPSPLSGSIGDSSLLAYLNPKRLMDSISFFWDRYILIYSGQDQVDTIMNLRDQYREMRRKFRQRFSPGEPPSEFLYRFWLQTRARLLLALSAGVVVVIIVRLWMKHLRRRHVIRTPILFYQEMLSILAKKGFPRPLHSTPAEFIKAIESQVPQQERSDLGLLTDLFYRARFGGYLLSNSDQSLVRESLRRLQQL
jgi:hypothetical protein